MKRPQVVAHRGFSSIAPENTIASVKEALLAGADMVEIDVHLSADGVPVVIHDSTLIRTTGVKGFVGEKSASFITSLDAGSWFDQRFSNERIPLLEQVLEETKHKAGLLIELKTHTFDKKKLADAVVGVLKASGRQDVIIQSFSSRILAQVKELTKDFELHKLVIGNLSLLPFHYDTSVRIGRTSSLTTFAGVNHNHKYVTLRLVERMKRSGLKIYTWTVNHEDEMLKMINAGVDGIITDKPDLLLNLLNKRKY